MKNRALLTYAILILVLVSAGACSKSKDSLDVDGLNLGKDLTSMLNEAAKVLGGITDIDSAKAALPKLVKMDSGLNDLVAKAAELTPESKSAMAGLVKGSLPAFESAVSNAEGMPGVGSIIKPTLDSIMSKIKGLV